MVQSSPSEDPAHPSPQPRPAGSRFALLPATPQGITLALCTLVLVATFFAPWVKYPTTASGFTFYHLDAVGRSLWIIPVLALATFFRLQSVVARKWLGTATAIAAWIGIGYVVEKTQAIGHVTSRLDWGAWVTALSAFALFAFSGERRLTAPIDLVARKLSSRKASVYSHSGTLTPDIHFSAQDFYENLETVIRDKQWPGVELVRIGYTEAGLLSHKREYLRVIRHRHLFDICAATFGKDYFFSIREAELPAVVDLRAFFVLMVALALLFCVSFDTFGMLFGSLAFVFLLGLLVWFFFNILKLGLTKVDSIFIQLPVIGPIYEAWFRKDTYFQQDTRIVFLQSVTDVVKRLVEATTSAKGIRFLNCFEHQPILDELYKRTRVKLEPQTPESPAA